MKTKGTIVDSLVKDKIIRPRATARPTYSGVSLSIKSLVSLTRAEIPLKYFCFDSIFYLINGIHRLNRR